MIRLILFTLPILFVTSICAADAKDDLRQMQGTWRPVSGELAGKTLGGDALKSTKLVIDGDKYTVTVGNSPDKGSLKVDASKNPKTMDIVGVEGPNKGKTILAIYEIKNDTLKICYELGLKGRPTEFKTKPDTQLFLLTYKREK